MRSFKRLLLKHSKRRNKKKNNKNIAKTTSMKNDCKFPANKQPSICPEEETGFSLRSSNNHRVQPLGNFFLSTSSHNSRDTGLGNLKTLTDELLLEILSLLGANHLGILATVSKSLYVFCTHEPLWRNLVLETFNGGFLYNGSWRKTYITSQFPCLNVLNIGSSGLVVRDFYSDYMFQSWLCANLELKHEWLQRDNIPRRKGISVEDFILNFEKPNKPVLLEGCCDSWVAKDKWDKDYLIKICGDVKFSVGPVEMKLEDYFRYSELTREERPLYLFDPKFAEKIPELGHEYEVPVYFREDLFSVLGDERPDYRWIIIGPAGSGSSFHIDPNSTSAWNAVIKGSKKWVLFPSEVVPPGVHPSPDGAEVACPVSIIEWFMNFYGATKDWTKRPVECICKAGDVIFVPNGWWHLVINLEESVAITQNYVSRYVLDSLLLSCLDTTIRCPSKCLLGTNGSHDRLCSFFIFPITCLIEFCDAICYYICWEQMVKGSVNVPS